MERQLALASPAASLAKPIHGKGGDTWKFLQILKAWACLLRSDSGRLRRVIWL